MKIPKSSFFFLFILFAQIPKIKNATNFFCAGDFQDYVLNSTGSDSRGSSTQAYVYAPVNSSCWFRDSSTALDVNTVLQIKQPRYPYYASGSKLLDFVTMGAKYGICQTVAVSTNCIYTITYNILLDRVISAASVSMSFDYSTVYTNTYSTTNKIYSETYTFNSSTSTSIVVCWNAVSITYSRFLYAIADALQFGPMFDNATFVYVSGDNSSTTTTTNSSSSSSTTNNSNTTNATTTTNSTTTANTTTTDDDDDDTTTTTTVQLLYLNFVSNQDVLTNRLVLDSDFLPSKFYLPLSFFNSIVVQIQGTLQNNIIYYQSSEGYLSASILPQQIYDSKSLNTLKLYFPQTNIVSKYKLVISIDGQILNYGALSEAEANMINSVDAVTTAITSGLKNAFLLLNSVSCSYFVVGLIGFFNLSLLDLFLHLTLLPNFARIFLVNLTYIFFKRGSISELLDKWINGGFSPNFTFMDNGYQKILTQQNEEFWFGQLGVTYNYLQNGFEPIVMLSMLVAKYCLLKIVVKIIWKKIAKNIDVAFYDFFQQFVEQVCVQTPFFLIPLVSALINMGQNLFVGKINFFLDILTNFLFLSFFIFGLNQALTKYKQEAETAEKENKSVKQIRKQTIVEVVNDYFGFLMFFVLPILITISNKLMFFFFMTPFILWRFVYAVKNIKSVPSKFDRVLIISNKFSWFVFHFSFLNLYLIEELITSAPSTVFSAIKILGFIVIFSVLFGALVDLIGAIVQMIATIFLLLKKIIKYTLKKIKKFKRSKITNTSQIIDPEIAKRIIRLSKPRVFSIVENQAVLSVAEHSVKKNSFINKKSIHKEKRKRFDHLSVKSKSCKDLFQLNQQFLKNIMFFKKVKQ